MSKLPQGKLEPWFVPWSFFLRGWSVSLKIYDTAIHGIVVMSGLVLPVATWNWWINYKIRYAQLLVLHLLPLLNTWLIFASLSLFYKYYILVDVYLNLLNWFHFLFLEWGLLVILRDCIIFLSPFLDVTRMSISTVSFHAQLVSGILCL